MFHLAMLVIVTVTLCPRSAAYAATVTWTGGGDGVSWNQASNWSSNPQLPGAADDVTIGAGVSVINVNVSVSVRSLSIGRAVYVNSSISLTNGLTLANNATLTMDRASLNFEGGTQTIAGTGMITAPANSSASFRLNSACQLTIAPGITIVSQTGFDSGDLLFYFYWDGALDARLTNQGTIRAQGSYSRLVLSNESSGNALPTLVNTGTIEVGSGSIATFGPRMSLSSTTPVTIGNAATFNLSSNATFLNSIKRTGTNSVNFDGPIPDGSTFLMTRSMGSVNFIGGTYTGVNFTAEAGQTYSFYSDTTFNACTFGAPVIMSTNPTITNGLTLANNATVMVEGTSLKFNGGTQTIAGTGTITAYYDRSVSFRLDNGCQLTIAPGITIVGELVANRGFVYFNFFGNGAFGARLINQGTIRSQGENSVLVFSNESSGNSLSTLVNTGTIEIGSGCTATISARLAASNEGVVRIFAGGLLNVNSTGSLSNTAENSLMEFRIANFSGNTSNYGRIAVLGTVTLGGAVRVLYDAGFNPTACGAGFPLISRTITGALTGTFGQTTLPAAPPSKYRSWIGYSLYAVHYTVSSRADLANPGGVDVPDGLVTIGDLICFLRGFFAQATISDIAGLGGTSGPDGRWTADDVVMFLSGYFAGCP